MAPSATTPREWTRLAEFEGRAQAERAVEILVDRGLPAGGFRIVGSGSRMVERVAGRSSPWRRAIRTIGIGAWSGLLVGVFFAAFADSSAAMVSLTLAGLAYGIAFGALVSVLALVAVRAGRQLSVGSAMAPSRYALLGVPTIAGEARRVLADRRTGL